MQNNWTVGRYMMSMMSAGGFPPNFPWKQVGTYSRPIPSTF